MPDRQEAIPPRIPGVDRGAPSIAEQPGYGSSLRRLAERQAPADAEAQSAQMVIEGANILMRAAELNPVLAPVVTQAISVLQSGISAISRGVGGPPPPPQRTTRRTRRSQPIAEGAEEIPY